MRRRRHIGGKSKKTRALPTTIVQEHRDLESQQDPTILKLGAAASAAARVGACGGQQ